MILDLHSRHVIRWRVMERMMCELVISAVENAIQTRSVTQALLLHSDRGTQHAGSNFVGYMADAAIAQSMCSRLSAK